MTKEELQSELWKMVEEQKRREELYWKIFQGCDDIDKIHDRAMQYQYQQGKLQGILDAYNLVRNSE